MKNPRAESVLFYLICLILVYGCGSSRTAPPELPKVFTEKETPPRPGSVPMKPSVPPAGPAAGKDVPAVRGYVPKDDPLFAVPGEPLTPSDFTLGTLHGRFAPGGDRAVDALFARFFQDLREGKSVKSLLHPGYRSFLSRGLEPFEGRRLDFDFVRYGEFSVPPRGEPMVETRILVIGKKGRAEGRILAEKVERTWYISQVILDLDELEHSYNKGPDGSFVPRNKDPVF